MEALVADFNIGKDQTVVFLNPFNGQVITWGNLTDFQSEPISTFLQSKPISAPQQVVTTYDGWKGSFTVDRYDSTVDDFFAQAEDSYWLQGITPDATITEYIADAKTGVIKAYVYTGVALKLDSAGNKQSNTKITQKISFESARRKKQA